MAGLGGEEIGVEKFFEEEFLEALNAPLSAEGAVMEKILGDYYGNASLEDLSFEQPVCGPRSVCSADDDYDTYLAMLAGIDEEGHREVNDKNSTALPAAALLGMVTRIIPAGTKEFRSAPCQAALGKELESLRSMPAWNEKDVHEAAAVLGKARQAGKEVMIGRIFGILGQKNSELVKEDKPVDLELCPYKGRIVFQGSSIQTASGCGAHALFQELSTAPSTLEQIRTNMALGALRPGNRTKTRDARKAYTQSRIDGEGRIPTWVRLPREWWPASWFGKDGKALYRDPIVRLLVSLYGHQESGPLWDKKKSKAMICCGWKELESCPDSWFHSGHDATMDIYVDDFVLNAAEKAEAKIWKDLEKHLDFGDAAEPIARHLGAYYSVERKDGLTNFKVSMEDYFREAVTKYKADTETTHLPVAHTPYTAEDYGDEVPGKHGAVAASNLMKCLFGDRVARPDAITATSFLARRVSKWKTTHDKMMKQLFCYLNTHADLALTGSLHEDDKDKVELHLWVDADLAGDLTTTKSTSGLWLELATPDLARCWPISWQCGKQATTACATVDSEAKTIIAAMDNEKTVDRPTIRAMSAGLRKVVIPILHQAETVLGRAVKLVAHEDNQQVVSAVTRGYSANLRHLPRHDRTGLGFTHEVFASTDDKGFRKYQSEIRYEQTKKQKADGFTKPLPKIEFEAFKSMLHMTAGKEEDLNGYGDRRFATEGGCGFSPGKTAKTANG